MQNDIKRYELSDNISIEQLKKAGFRNGGWISEIKEPKIQYTRLLIDEIELHIEVSLIDEEVSSFDDFHNIWIIDNDFCQPYSPFYDSTADFPYLNRVISRYNKEMDKLVSKGILKSIVLEESPKKLVRKPNKKD